MAASEFMIGRAGELWAIWDGKPARGYGGLGISDPLEVIRIADKIDKIGAEGVGKLLASELGLSAGQVTACLDLAQIRGTGTSVIDQITRLGVSSAVLSEGLDELAFVLGSLSDLPAGSIVADLSVARGLAYYTGTVYEGKFTGWPGYGSICSGGRYDNLVALVRGRKGRSGDGFALGQYVNDRPYAASSMLAMALKDVFRTALTGRCNARPELAASPIPLDIHVPAVPCRGGERPARSDDPGVGRLSLPRRAADR